jgi:hypothetical protein
MVDRWGLHKVGGVLLERRPGFDSAQPSLGVECFFEVFEVFGGSELGVEVAGDRVVVLGAIGVAFMGFNFGKVFMGKRNTTQLA